MATALENLVRQMGQLPPAANSSSSSSAVDWTTAGRRIYQDLEEAVQLIGLALSSQVASYLGSKARRMAKLCLPVPTVSSYVPGLNFNIGQLIVYV